MYNHKLSCYCLNVHLFLMLTAHPSCLELPQEIVPFIKSYAWQCIECKKCVKCMDPGNEVFII